MAELRFIQDFPAKGVKFIDISPKLTDKDDFKAIIDEMTSKVPDNTDYIIAPESRGYIFGTAMAINLGLGFIISNVDVAAHFGGLLGGLFITIALGIKYKSTKIEQINGWLVTLMFVGFLIYGAFIMG